MTFFSELFELQTEKDSSLSYNKQQNHLLRGSTCAALRCLSEERVGGLLMWGPRNSKLRCLCSVVHPRKVYHILQRIEESKPNIYHSSARPCSNWPEPREEQEMCQCSLESVTLFYVVSFSCRKHLFLAFFLSLVPSNLLHCKASLFCPAPRWPGPWSRLAWVKSSCCFNPKGASFASPHAARQIPSSSLTGQKDFWEGLRIVSSTWVLLSEANSFDALNTSIYI